LEIPEIPEIEELKDRKDQWEIPELELRDSLEIEDLMEEKD
jgi:hypothetical protein